MNGVGLLVVDGFTRIAVLTGYFEVFSGRKTVLKVGKFIVDGMMASLRGGRVAMGIWKSRARR